MVIGPTKILKDISNKLAQAFAEAAKDPGYIRYLESRSANEFFLPAEEIQSFCDGRRKLVRSIMGKAGILKDR